MNQKKQQLLTFPGNRKPSEKLLLPGRKSVHIVRDRKIIYGDTQEECTSEKKEVGTLIEKNKKTVHKSNKKNKKNGNTGKENCNKNKNNKNTHPGKNKAKKHLKYTKRYITKIFMLYPALANLKQPIPLALNIDQQMLSYALEQNLPIAHAEIKKALRYYTLQKTYHLAILRYNWRRDIYGKKTTKLTQEEKAFAAEKLRTMVKVKETNNTDQTTK